MHLERRSLILIAALGSLVLLAGAFAFQHIGGLAPCRMCIWQRYPHAAALPIGAFALIVSGIILPLLGALAALATGAIGVFHTGVERNWWEGPQTCSSARPEGLTPEELLDHILNAPLVRCDEVSWQMLGLSMASWNSLASFGLALIWLLAVRRSA